MATATIVCNTTQSSVFYDELVSGNLSIWGVVWPAANNTSIDTLGLGSFRHGHSTKFNVDMNLWGDNAPTSYNWNATGHLTRTGQWSSDYGNLTLDFQNMADWLADRNIPVMYTLSDEIAYNMRTGEQELDWAKVATAWRDLIGYHIGRGVDIKWIEIGNECEIWSNQGIQFPNVYGATGHGSSYPTYAAQSPYGIDPEQPEDYTAYPNNTNDYIKLWEAVVPVLKASFPSIQVGAYAAGQGPVKTRWYPFNYLFQTARTKPDFFAYHHYPSNASTGVIQAAVDSTFNFQGFEDEFYDNNWKSIRDAIVEVGAPANVPIYLTEWNHNSAGYTPTRDAWWDAVFVVTSLMHMANDKINGAYYWDTFNGSDTGGALDHPGGAYLTSGYALRWMSQFKGHTTFTWSNSMSANDYVAYDLPPSGASIVPATTRQRVQVLPLQNPSTGEFNVIVANKNASTSHTANVDLSAYGGTTQQVTIKVYSSRTQLANETPTTTTPNLSSGIASVTLPALSFAVITLDGDPVEPPVPDTTPPTVSITSPVNGEQLSGSFNITATASDNIGVDRVEFRVDGALVGTDTTAPYTASWTPPSPTITGPAVSFTFDDGNVGVYTQWYPLLSSYGFKATVYLNTDDQVNGYSEKLSVAQLDTLYAAGWEIGSHSADHFTSLPPTPTQADYEVPIARAKAWLDSHGYIGGGFATPGGANNPTLNAAIAKYHNYSRAAWGLQLLPLTDLYSLSVTDPTTANLNSTISGSDWLITLDHAWSGPDGTFVTFLDQVLASGVRVDTVQNVVSVIPGPKPTVITARAYDAAGNYSENSVHINGDISATRGWLKPHRGARVRVV